MADARSTPPVLSIRDLHVYYGASHALQGVTITQSEGIHTVLGRNGMGKTTLCKAILGLVPVHSGSIRFEGRELVGLKPHRIARLGVGYSPQQRRLWPSLTVDEHLRLCETKGSPWTPERIYDLFPRLAERRRNGGAQLSGGEQQMLAISRSLMANPRLLVMDEPTEGLAPVIVHHVEAMLRKIAEDGVSILLIEQNISVATALADKAAIMSNGRILTVIDAKRLAADRALQQRLLGVGRASEDDQVEFSDKDLAGGDVDDNQITNLADEAIPPAVSAPPTPADLPDTEPSLPPSSPSTSGYVPPPRWSSAHWNNMTAIEPQPMQSELPLSLSKRNNLDRHVLVAGTFDTKGPELNYIRERLISDGLRVKTIDLSTSGQTSAADVPPHHIAQWHPEGTAGVFTGDRGKSVGAMAEAFTHWIKNADGIAGIISAAGSGGTALATPAMQALPIGLPKMMISTLASGNVANYVGASDIMMMYSVTDIQGVNRISAKVLANGADALAGAVLLAKVPAGPKVHKLALGLTTSGATINAAEAITRQLQHRFDCLPFHATGTGGRSMEKLIDGGVISTVIDLTTLEIANMLMGGIFAASEDRLGAVIRTGIPYVGSAGALDIVNWGAPETVPAHVKERLFYNHSPQITLMRTNADENQRLAIWLGQKLNQMTGPVRFLWPQGGLSSLDVPGGVFWNPEANNSFYAAVKSTFQETANKRLISVPHHINAPGFSDAVVRAFHEINPSSSGGFHGEL